MFRRESTDDGPELYSAIGLWGSGNVVTDRENLGDGDNSGWSMWDGHALFGPARPDQPLEKFPALVAVLELQTFLDRYASLGDACELWVGDEVLGVGCDVGCAHMGDLCPDRDVGDCERDCERLPRMVVDCIAAATECRDEAQCIEDAELGQNGG